MNQAKLTGPEGKNWGTISLMLSCTPADITFPTDLKLLQRGENGTEKIIDDAFCTSPKVGRHRPHYNREKSSFSFLRSQAEKSQGLRKIKGCSEEQLSYLQRILSRSSALIAVGHSLSLTSSSNCRTELLPASVLHGQQATFSKRNTRSIPHRLVHLVQKQVRPIVEEKQGSCGFGAKIASLGEGFPFSSASLAAYTRWRSHCSGRKI